MSFSDLSHSLAVATVGTKGQIVIPLETRERLGVGPGDKVVIMMRGNEAAMLLPMACMKNWLDKMSADFDELQSLARPAANKEKGTL